ncbi:MAG TPA: alpha/beta fold hydrolase [Cellvibrionaceae bacterium]|nr:alpha/beta fold hydrolase [Cellvibrionaceae bacterium]
MTSLATLEIPTAAHCTHCVIWLHGLGASNRDFVDALPHLKLPSALAVNFIFPQAPSIPVTINQGYIMPAWYDILDIKIERTVDQKQLIASADLINQIIQQQLNKGIKPERIVLAGFSQGGAVAIHAALSCAHRLAGLAVLSSYLAIPEVFNRPVSAAKLPVIIQHGNQDDVVPLSLGERAATEFRHQGFNVQWQTFSMGHQVNLASLAALGEWMGRVLTL